MSEIDRLLYRSKKVLDKKYRQFDFSLNEKKARSFIKNTVLDPDKVANYRFLPFITYQKKQKKYSRTKGHLRAHLKVKIRPISLVAHHDALIYIKYAEELNKKYEDYLLKKKLKDVPTAYRKEIHQSNIDAAKDVFDYIVNTDGCWIIKGDFKGFFDNLRHAILKRNLCNVLGVEQLETDWQAVIKSLTRYRSVSSEELVSSMKKAGIPNNKDAPYTRSRKELAKIIYKGGLKVKGPNQIGIPQGTSLSAVLANVYMVEFDEIMNNVVSKRVGLYRRYSDDFIITIPKENLRFDELKDFIDEVMDLSKEKTRLQIEKRKTKVFDYDENATSKIGLIDLKKHGLRKASWLDYLGFIFSGDVVRMRDKGIYKFHYKSKRAINLFTRIEHDRKQIIEGTVPSPEDKTRYVWINGNQVFKSTKQIPKQDKFIRRIKQTKKGLKYNQTRAELAAKMYLVPKRYGEYYTMIGYAKRAQKILSQNNGKYRVEVLNQIKKQININQKKVAKNRKNS